MRRFATLLVIALAACVERSPADEPEDVEPCDFDAAVDDVVSESSEPPTDCGFVDVEDGLDAWQRADTCANEAIATGTAMLLRWKPRVIDGLSIQAIVATSNPVSLTWVSYSGYDDENIRRNTCEQIAMQEGCTVSVGQMCFECIARGADVDICP